MNEAQTKKSKNVPESLQKMYEKAVTTKSPRKAIRIFCLECCGYVKKEVENCTGLACPLYAYRLGGWPNKGTIKKDPNSRKQPDYTKFAATKGGNLPSVL
jgi:hypothetical protein